MAVKPSILYPAQIDVSDLTNYPHGKARNDVVPDDGQGTPLEQGWVNDLFGFQQAVLQAGAVTPSGTADKVGASQYLAALRNVILGDIVTANYTVGDIVTSAGVPSYTGTIKGIAYSSTLRLFVAVGDYGAGSSGIFVSGDLISWNRIIVAGINDLYDVCWSGTIGKYFACGTGGIIVSSPDGLAWSIESPGGGFTGEFYGISASQTTDTVVVVGFNVFTGGAIQRKIASGGAWTAATLPITERMYCTTRCDALGKFWAAGQSGKILSSADGLTSWTEETADASYAGEIYGIGSSEFLQSVVFAGTSAGIQQSSGSGTWTARTADNYSFQFNVVLRIEELGKWVLLGSTNGTVMTSNDGITWRNVTQDRSSSPLAGYAAAYGNGMLALAGTSAALRIGLRI